VTADALRQAAHAGSAATGRMHSPDRPARRMAAAKNPCCNTDFTRDGFGRTEDVRCEALQPVSAPQQPSYTLRRSAWRRPLFGDARRAPYLGRPFRRITGPASTRPRTEPVHLLLRLELRRLADAFRHPRPAAWLAVVLPVALAAGALWTAADSVRPDVSTGDGVVLLGLLVAVPVGIQAYPILFRPADDAFLRRLGISTDALFGVRALRLLAFAVALSLGLMLPYVATGENAGRPLAVALAAGVATWAASLVAQGRAAADTVSGRKPSLMSQALGQGYDYELIAAGPLVYAPIWPAVAGAAAAGFAGSGVWPMPLRLALILAGSAALVPLGARAFARALPRFAPHAGELAYAPPPDASGGELVLGRGIASVLPRRAQAVRARDAVVIGRRYRWASRLAWPVAVVGALAVLRAGGSPGVRAWVTLACGAMLAAQAAAIVALGRSERGRTRWTDRTAGIRPAARFAGRWAAAFGLVLIVAMPMAAGWWIRGDGGAGWAWIAAAGVTALAAAGSSLAAAGR